MLLPEDTAAVCSAMCSTSPKAMLGSAESGKEGKEEEVKDFVRGLGI